MKFKKLNTQNIAECSGDGCCCSSSNDTQEINSAEKECACALEPDEGSKGEALVQNKVGEPTTILKVDGITCMDCAQKFEKAVNELPGVIKAQLNTVTGKLKIEGYLI